MHEYLDMLFLFKTNFGIINLFDTEPSKRQCNTLTHQKPTLLLRQQGSGMYYQNTSQQNINLYQPFRNHYSITTILL